ncbi:hypothetical protein FLJC2902T_32350 [Flavobacterium limnosediminis JC2902]|uniref:Uncharacterized protein n=1 Tax=Flavobacterium limnosediminis JC2902 TaxID=1341181 RepID=V6S8C1_9FLAO|nr:hypothetical protein [Flavobacterium limnosediminis]ESU22943.1 hypothetical protein FLJC2902T_32350 [Flavobacterium limnosediminis JC2902]
MKSKFTLKGFIFPILGICLITGLLVIIINNLPIKLQQLRWIDYLISALILIIIIWLVFFEINRKMIVIKIENEAITKRNLLNGIYRVKFDECDGYTTAIESTRIGLFEELSIEKGGKKVIIISEKYHLNYQELKKIIDKKLKYLGGAAINYR